MTPASAAKSFVTRRYQTFKGGRRWRVRQTLTSLCYDLSSFALIYLFIPTAGLFYLYLFFLFFFCASPISLFYGGGSAGVQSDESGVVILSGVVKIHLAPQYINMVCRRPNLSRWYHKNQLIWPAACKDFIFVGFFFYHMASLDFNGAASTIQVYSFLRQNVIYQRHIPF